MLTIGQIYTLGIKLGTAADPRGTRNVKKYLDRVKKEFEEMKPEEKKFFDKEKLANPYDDCRIHLGNPDTKVKRILTGIDMGSGEVLLASQLGERGKTVDLMLAHHPIGGSLASLHGVMDMAVDIYAGLGVPVHVAEKITEERIKEVGRSVHPANHYQIIDMARLLKVNLMNLHTITDNLVHRFLHGYLKKKRPETVGELVKALLEIPEYAEAKKRGAGPRIIAGGSRCRTGKILLEVTGGSNPSNKVYEALSRAGIDTIVGMHMKEDAVEKANEHHLNVVIAGHISSDSLGMNLFLDALEKKGIEVIPCGGLIRIKRIDKK